MGMRAKEDPSNVVGRGAGEVRSVGNDVDEMRNIGMNGMEIGEGVHARTPCTPRGQDRGRMVAGEKMEK
ncbi:hypothetical protein K0M31_004731 [Melipona bicolor]|uniref:Uncharacterized protein n=1 Tax=Melipona bicolor TaxID=60889 RepID=A0AA40FWD5_9HYME|nr:hypothetical protein K0M31_004731 [Melipona bicolor]